MFQKMSYTNKFAELSSYASINISVQAFSRTPGTRVQPTNLNLDRVNHTIIWTHLKHYLRFQAFQRVLFLFYFNMTKLLKKKRTKRRPQTFYHEAKILNRKTKLTWEQMTTIASRSSPNSSSSTERFWKSSV